MSDISFANNIDALFSDIHNLAKSENVLGNPVSVGDKTLVPVMAVTVGYGSTGMGTKLETPNTKHDSNGLGLGARISTSAVMVIDNKKDDVQMLPVSGNGNMAQLMQKIPDALTNIGSTMMGKGAMAGQGQGQGQQQSSGQQGTGGGQMKSNSQSGSQDNLKS